MIFYNHSEGQNKNLTENKKTKVKKIKELIKMKKTVTRKIFAGIMAAVCSVSAMSAVTAMTVSAASPSVSVSSVSRQVAVVNLKGEDWNYSADSLCAKITCDYNWSTCNCCFKASGVTPGVTNAVLKAEVEDGYWQNVPMKFTVDNNLNVKGQQNGSVYYTCKKKSQSGSQTQQQAAPKYQSSTTTYTMKGCNWNYSADSLCASIGCDFNWNTSTCKFIITASKPGVTNAVLKAKRTDGKWNNTPIRFTVDNNLNISYQKTGDMFVTNN